MIQDIAPHQLFNQYSRAAEPRETDFVLIFSGAEVLLNKKEDRWTIPTCAELGIRNAQYLLGLDDVRFYLAPQPAEIPGGYAYVPTRSLRGDCGMPKHLIFALLTGKHLADWYRDNRFCGRCGSPMSHKTDERAMRCNACGYTAYPRIMPAVIVGVTNGDKLLLTRYRTGYGHNALIAGFTEIGETAEETVAREVMEEAGVRVKNIRYYKTQPWAIANDLLLGYFCDLDGSEEITMDTGELKYAQWVSREDIVLQPDDFSLTNEMMCRFKNGEV